MASVVIEYFNGETASFANARYRIKGSDFVVTRNGKVCVRIGSAYVYDIGIVDVDSGGHVSHSDTPGPKAA